MRDSLLRIVSSCGAGQRAGAPVHDRRRERRERPCIDSGRREPEYELVVEDRGPIDGLDGAWRQPREQLQRAHARAAVAAAVVVSVAAAAVGCRLEGEHLAHLPHQRRGREPNR